MPGGHLFCEHQWHHFQNRKKSKNKTIIKEIIGHLPDTGKTEGKNQKCSGKLGRAVSDERIRPEN